MSKKGNLTRAQAAAIVGAVWVDLVESKNCEPTGRVGYNGACQGDELCEWRAGVTCGDQGCTVAVYYYTSNDDDQTMGDNDGDGSAIDWVIAGYEIV